MTPRPPGAVLARGAGAMLRAAMPDPRRELDAACAELGADELRVLSHLARRLLAGQRAYGRLDLAKDGRDWRHERAEELADALLYGAFAEVAGSVEGGRR